MIPQTVAALVGFLALVAPGLTFELQRERRRPRIDETAFREASRVALASLCFTVLSIAVLALSRFFAPNLTPDVANWLRLGNTAYLRDHYRVVGWTALAELILACMFALLAATVIGRARRARIRTGSAWYLALRTWRKSGEVALALITLNDGDRFYGTVRGYSPESKLEGRELVLGSPIYYQAVGDQASAKFSNWNYVIFPASSIMYLAVRYVKRPGTDTENPSAE